jgi:hypothetical protein
MSTIESTCVGCGEKRPWEDIDFGEVDPEAALEAAIRDSALPDEKYEVQQKIDQFIADHDEHLRTHGARHLCGICTCRVDKDFRRPDRSSEKTLADVLANSWHIFLTGLLKPKGSPAHQAILDDTISTGAILRRVGRSVAILFDDDQGAGPFVAFAANAAGELCSESCDHLAIVAMGAADARDYLPDGSPRNAGD